MFTPLNSQRALTPARAQAITFGVNVATLRRSRMKVGDLVIMPGSCYRDKSDNPATGIILKTKRDGINRDTSRFARVEVYWIADAEASWEPLKWLEVVSEK